MIIRSLNNILRFDTNRNVAWGNGNSRRFLLESDGMGFTLTDTLVKAGTESLLQYRNHLEACYCVEGEGEVECKGKVYSITPGTMYAPNKHEKHYLRATKTLRLICVFTPPLKGHESHQINKEKASAY